MHHSCIDRLNAVDAELKDLKGKRDAIVPQAVELPENLPELYRTMVSDLAASLSDEAIAGRAADTLHDLIDGVVVHWDTEANGHRLVVSGNLLEMLRKSAPRELEAVSGDILGEVGCGRAIWTLFAALSLCRGVAIMVSDVIVRLAPQQRRSRPTANLEAG